MRFLSPREAEELAAAERAARNYEACLKGRGGDWTWGEAFPATWRAG
jgi:hypothetical protein